MAYAECSSTSGKIEVHTSYSEKDMIKAIPGSSWDAENKVWTLRKSWAACVQLRGTFKDNLVIGPELREWAGGERSARVDATVQLRDRITPNVGYSGSDRLKEFQKAGVQFLWWAKSAILGDEMGTGKTVQALELMRHLGMEESLPGLVIAPKSVVPNWKREAAIWFPEAVPYLVEGTATKRRKILAEASKDPYALVLMNYEAVRLHSRLKGFGSILLKRCAKCDKYGTDKETQCEVHPRELNDIPFKMMIVDEAHRMKDPKSKQTRALWAVAAAKSMRRVVPMTGTLVSQNASDMWAILHAVSPDEFPTKSKFVDRYCETEFNRWGGLEIGGLNPKNRDELFKFLEPRFRRTPKALVLHELPQKVHMTRYVQLTPDQRKIYDALKTNREVRLADGSLMIPPKDVTVHLRLGQLACASLESDGTPNGFRMCDPSPKLDAMEEILEDMDGKPIVFAASSRQIIDMAAKRLEKRGIPYALIVGGIPQWDREAQLRQFQAGELKVLLFTMKAGGVGLTMTAADTICVLQWSDSLIENMQSIDRVHRIGSEIHQQVNVISIIAENTVEVGQLARLKVKEERLEQINQDRERLRAAGISTAHLDVEEQIVLSTPLHVEDDGYDDQDHAVA